MLKKQQKPSQKHPVIEIMHLSKKVGKSLLLDDLSLTIQK